MLNALTIDVEDYYHVSAFESVIRFEDWDHYESRVERNTYRILDILNEYNTKGTFFVLGWVAERYSKVVQTIYSGGHEIASHGYSHRRVYTQSQEQFREETKRAKRVLEDIIGQPIIGYRAASYSITGKSLWALEILARLGFEYDSSIFPIRHDRYGIVGHDRFPHILNGEGKRAIAEFPLSTIRILGMNVPVAGGGYLRLLPDAITHRAILHLNEIDKRPAIVYFHPWEIDSKQPRINAGWCSRLRHYTNLSRTEMKIKALLTTFSFAPMRQVYAGVLRSLTSKRMDTRLRNTADSSTPVSLR